MEAEMKIVLAQEEANLFDQLKDMRFKYGKFDIRTIRKRREWIVVATTLKRLK